MENMRAGQLRHRLDLQTKVPTRGSFGEEILTWKTQVTVWGSVESLSGREYLQAQANQLQSEVTHQIRLRYYKGLRPDWRIKFGSRIFDILSGLNPDERNKELLLMAREFVT
jgi:SPP1 family predicted phage head-tail adaptor